MDSLFSKEYSIKISNFFSTGWTGPQSFSSARVHRSRFEYRALGLVSIISPSSELGIMHHFLWTPYSSSNILSKFKIFSQSVRPVPKVLVQPKFIGASSNTEHLGLFRPYLPHPNLESCIVFLIFNFNFIFIFYGILVLQGILYKNFKFFLNRVD